VVANRAKINTLRFVLFMLVLLSAGTNRPVVFE
jgi:hypothetical protein